MHDSFFPSHKSISFISPGACCLPELSFALVIELFILSLWEFFSLPFFILFAQSLPGSNIRRLSQCSAGFLSEWTRGSTLHEIVFPRTNFSISSYESTVNHNHQRNALLTTKQTFACTHAYTNIHTRINQHSQACIHSLSATFPQLRKNNRFILGVFLPQKTKCSV